MIKFDEFDPIFKYKKKLIILNEHLNKMPSNYVLNTFFQYYDDNNFNEFKKILENKLNFKSNIKLPLLSFNKFKMGLNSSLPKYLYIKESLTHNINESQFILYALLSNINETSFNDFNNKISKDYSNLVKINEKARDGQGSLKELVDKKVDDKLTPQDAIRIGKLIANMIGEDKKKYIGMVNYMGTTCIVYNAIKNSYLSTIQYYFDNNGKNIKGKKIEYEHPERLPVGGESLKSLVNKNLKDTLNVYDGRKIGNQIAKMKKKDKRDFVGMMNFLGASCNIHKKIKEAYIKERNNIEATKKNEKNKNTINIENDKNAANIEKNTKKL